MENKQIPKREEKLWSEIKNYQVATNNARILGVLDELIINEKTGKIVDIAIRVESGRNIHVKGAKRNGDILLVPFAVKAEEMIIEAPSAILMEYSTGKILYEKIFDH